MRLIPVRERERQALELRKTGANFEVIARELNVGVAQARQLVYRGLQRLTREPAAELVDLENARLDQLLAAVWERALEGHLPSIDRVLKIMERRAKLLGLDRPTQTELTVQQRKPVTADDLIRLREELERRQQRAAEDNEPLPAEDADIVDDQLAELPPPAPAPDTDAALDAELVDEGDGYDGPD